MATKALPGSITSLPSLCGMPQRSDFHKCQCHLSALTPPAPPPQLQLQFQRHHGDLAHEPLTERMAAGLKIEQATSLPIGFPLHMPALCHIDSSLKEPLPRIRGGGQMRVLGP